MEQPRVPPRLDGPAPTESSNVSTLALLSLILGLVSVCFCALAPVTALPAVILGLLAQREINRSEGKVGGAMLGFVGAGTGILGIFIFVGYVITVTRSTSHTPPPVVPPTPTVVTGPTATTTPGPHPGPGPAPTANQGEITTSSEIVETKLGNVWVVDVPASTRALRDELKKQLARAQSEKQHLAIFLTFDECRPCMSTTAIMLDAKMQKALADWRLVRVNSNERKEELEDLGIPTKEAPGIFIVNNDLKVTDGITGGEWDDDTPENIAPVLEPFLRGKYSRRKHPIRLLPQAPADRDFDNHKGGKGGKGAGGKGSYL